MKLDYYNCEQAFRVLDDFIDRELTPEEMQLVQQHLDICALCATEFRFEAETVQALRARVQRIAIPAGLSDRITSALRVART